MRLLSILEAVNKTKTEQNHLENMLELIYFL